MMIRNWTCLSSNPIPSPTTLQKLSLFIQIHRAHLHFQWEGKEVSRLLIASFVVFSRKKTKQRQQPQPCSAETGFGGEALLKTDGGSSTTLS